MNYIVLDFGGSSVKCAVMNSNAQIMRQFSLSSQVDSYDSWLDMFAPHFDKYRNEFNVQGIAISSCGAVDVDSGIIHGSSALPYIHDIDVKALYNERFNVPVELENDACCAALAESWIGKGKHSDHFCLLVIGTGVGGAIVTQHSVMKGHHLHGGEFGYMIMDYQDDQPVILGHLASTHALVVMTADKLGVPVDSLNGLKVFEMYDENHSEVIAVVDKWLKYLATGIYNIQYSVDPEVIIIGGAISQRNDLIDLLNKTLDSMLAVLPVARIRPNLEVSEFGNDANLVGALKHYLNRQGS
ncbi:ROK family protein [Vibrio renipiscarius]|uniref:Transcriptional regulator n=1 Tax=Vibrio renipiscarius TaxID=1461322 RepID=A0A0C2N6Q4_9VIBR|nr:ROK family protein [Vibrio renipiscarius]KII75311.1 transcriptional regulator [Vibrio renipiscarius]KII78763.1 transcriptional regulator [Vibrio renipiscarius]